MPSLVGRVDFVSIATRDMEAAVEFYGTVLGLPCSARYRELHGAEFETGNLTLQLLDSAAMGLEYRTAGSRRHAPHRPRQRPKERSRAPARRRTPRRSLGRRSGEA